MGTSSASDITQAEKSWMSQLCNPKLATNTFRFLWAYSGTGGGTPPGHTQILRPRNL